MGQKTNPRIFQLSKTSNWQSKYFEKKSTEYSIYSKKDLEIRGFIEKFFKIRNRTVHRCKICYFEKSLHIFVSYHLNAKLPFLLRGKIPDSRKFKKTSLLRGKIPDSRKFKKISLFHGSIPNPDRFEERKNWNEPCKIPQLTSFKCRIIKSYIKQMFHKIKRPIKTLKLARCKIWNKTLQFVHALQKRQVSYLEKTLKTLSIIIYVYKKIKASLVLNAKILSDKHLRGPAELLGELTRTIYIKKLRNNDEKEKKRTGALKNILAEKLADSLQYFTANNFRLWIHLKALNLNRSDKARKKIKKILKKNIVKLRRFKEEKFYREGVEMLLTCSATRKPSALLAQFLAIQLKALKKHNFFLRFIKDGLNLFNTTALSKMKRIKIKIKGRLNARPKAKRRFLKIGKDVSVVRIRASIDYSEKTAFTSNGTLGIKVWIHEFSN